MKRDIMHRNGFALFLQIAGEIKPQIPVHVEHFIRQAPCQLVTHGIHVIQIR
jgi:hypothetical protein